MKYACVNRTCSLYLVERNVEEPVGYELDNLGNPVTHDAQGVEIDPTSQELATYDPARVCTECRYPMWRFPDGMSGEPTQPIPAEPPPAPEAPSQDALQTEAVSAIRSQRDVLLQQSDWTQMSDVQSGMDAATRRAWAAYRQALRDFMANVPDPFNPPAFPSLPATSVVAKQALTLTERLLLQVSQVLGASSDFPTAKKNLTDMAKAIQSGQGT